MRRSSTWSTTGAATALGSGNAGYECAYQASWDASSKTLYGTIWDADSVLVKWDTLTGALVEVGPVLDGVTPVDVDTLVIRSGWGGLCPRLQRAVSGRPGYRCGDRPQTPGRPYDQRLRSRS